MRNIGQRLKDRRRELGLSLGEAEAVTKIRKKYLEALEAGDQSQVPGEIYFKGFLRAYGEYLGLDGWELVREYRAGHEATEGGGTEGRLQRMARQSTARAAQVGVAVSGQVAAVSGRVAAVSQRAAATAATQARETVGSAPAGRRSRSGVPRHLVAAILVLSLVAGAGVWYALGSGVSDPGPGAPVAGGGGQPGTGDGGQPGTGDGGQPGTGDGGQNGAGDDGTPPPVPGEIWRRASESASRVSYVVYGAPFEVGLKVNDRCWIKVVADGQVVLEENLEGGSLGRWSAREKLTVIVGRAGVVEVTLEGNALGTAGTADDVRTLTFESGSPPGD